MVCEFLQGIGAKCGILIKFCPQTWPNIHKSIILMARFCVQIIFRILKGHLRHRGPRWLIDSIISSGVLSNPAYWVMSWSACSQNSSMTVEIEIKLNGMTDALVYYRSRRAIPVNNVALIWPREKSGRPLDKQPFRDCRYYWPYMMSLPNDDESDLGHYLDFQECFYRNCSKEKCRRASR